MTAIRFPILLSLGLHGLAVGVLSLVPFGAKAVFEERHEIRVELVEPAPPPVVEAVLSPTPLEPTPPVLQQVPRAERQAMRHVVSRPLSRKAVPLVQQTKERESKPLSPSEPVPAFPVPAFMEVPPNFSLAALRTTNTPDPGPGPEVEVGASVASLPEDGILPPLKRPVFQTTSISGHLLRDPTPDTAGRGRSKVKLGDNLRPEYPRPAREAGWEGTVMLRVEVLPDGNAGAVAVHRSSGHGILDEAAVTAVQRWQFTPAMDGNFPIRSVVHLPVKFDLRTPY